MYWPAAQGGKVPALSAVVTSTCRRRRHRCRRSRRRRWLVVVMQLRRCCVHAPRMYAWSYPCRNGSFCGHGASTWLFTLHHLAAWRLEALSMYFTAAPRSCVWSGLLVSNKLCALVRQAVRIPNHSQDHHSHYAITATVL